jgi:DNA invertase Pin-like site-specific DNA recombinase
MKNTLIGYARCSTDKQDLSAQRQALFELGVSHDLIYTDHGLTGTNRARPGLDQGYRQVIASKPQWGSPVCFTLPLAHT